MTSWLDLPLVDDDGSAVFVDENDYNGLLNNIKNIYERVLAVEAQVGGGIPLGGAVLWYGLASQVPDGWHIMDGSNGLMNMLGKFAMGAAIDGDVGLAGGSASHLHTNQNLPTYSTLHNHAIDITAQNLIVYLNVQHVGSGCYLIGPHAHQVTGDSGDNGAHGHTVSVTSIDGSLPPYKRLYWIGRIR